MFRIGDVLTTKQQANCQHEAVHFEGFFGGDYRKGRAITSILCRTEEFGTEFTVAEINKAA